MIYSGQELPNTKRLKFFDKDPIDWNNRYQLNDFYKTLLSLKKDNPSLRAGDAAVTTHLFTTSADKSILAYLRKNGNSEVLVFINFSKEKVSFEVDDVHFTGHFTNVFSKEEQDFTLQKHFELQPWDYKVFEKK